MIPFNRFHTNDHYLFLILSRHLWVGMLYEILFWTDIILDTILTNTLLKQFLFNYNIVNLSAHRIEDLCLS